ncbi:hypothetical protein [Ciceribacter selenitireducens]|uniref:hypothetical protein n=1 Tax=Ciceribacter selenitireducens TaxID=448181 RepID=UPI0004B773A0|nr:hypothetical protein [Ciceribacter selenitireducens]
MLAPNEWRKLPPHEKLCLQTALGTLGRLKEVIRWLARRQSRYLRVMDEPQTCVERRTAGHLSGHH